MKYKDFLLNPHPHNQIEPFIIAEAGVNHEGSIDIAKQLIDLAAAGGADAIKFQTYKAETIASKNSPSYWDLNKEKTQSQFELFQKYDSFWKGEFEILKAHCDDMKIEFCSTPFDFESANFLNDLMEFFKISSSDITNKPFIENIASYNKPIILSTGASSLSEIERAVSWIQDANPNINISLLHCILNYPTPNENANIMMIQGLIEKFNSLQIGYSDHTLPGDNMDPLFIASLLGANILEKHFTHDKKLPGNDHYHAMDINDLKLFKSRLNELNLLLGQKNIDFIDDEIISRKNARRSIVSSKKINKGQIITNDDISFKRPGHGIQPFELEELLGSKAISNIDEDETLLWDMFEK